MPNKYPMPVVVGLCASTFGGECLFVHRLDTDLSIQDSHRDVWYFPGGKIELNETPQDALVREYKEEFELDITVGALIPVIKNYSFLRVNGETIDVILIPYHVYVKPEDIDKIKHNDRKHLSHQFVQANSIRRFADNHNVSKGAIPILEWKGWL